MKDVSSGPHMGELRQKTMGKDQITNGAATADTRRHNMHWLEDSVQHGELHREFEVDK